MEQEGRVFVSNILFQTDSQLLGVVNPFDYVTQTISPQKSELPVNRRIRETTIYPSINEPRKLQTWS